jgi:dihydrofolate reductase
MLIFGVWSAAAPPFVVLMLLSEKAKSRSVGLLVGCVVGGGGAVALFAWLDSLLPTQDSSGSSLAGGFDQHRGSCAPRGVGAERVARAAGAPPRPLRGRATVVFGRNTYQTFAQMLGSDADEAGYDVPVTRMRSLPATVVSTTLDAPFDWPDATVANGDAVGVVARLKEGSAVPLRWYGSLSMNRALMAAGLVDRIQLTVFPVITGQTGDDPTFLGAADFDLELIDSRTLDGNIQELVHRPTLHA